MGNPFLLTLVAYSLVLILAGFFLARNTRGASDFFVASRRLGPGLLFSTLLAANIGSGSTVGAAGLGYRLGLSGWWWVGSAGIGSLLLAFTVGPKIRDLAQTNRFLTVGDFLEYRYNRTVRGVVAGLLWFGTLSILAGQLIAIATILAVVAETPKWLGCLLGGVVVIAYFTAGGLKGTAWINLLQLVVKGLGFFLSVPLALAFCGGWDVIRERILAGGAHGQEYFSLTGIGASGILVYLLPLVPAFVVSPGLLQKIYGARDSKAVRLGVAAQGATLLAYSFLPVALGMAAAASFPGLSNPERALPTVMTEMLPFWLGALLLASVFSAELSSADAVLFMMATSMSRDLYQGFWNPLADEDRLLAISRLASIISGAIGVGLAILLPSVISALVIFYSLMTVSLAVPLVFGIYRRYPGTRSCLAAIAAGTVTTGLTLLLTAGEGVGAVPPTGLGILASLAVVLGARLATRRGG